MPGGRVVIEKSLLYNKMQRRCDVLVYGDNEPVMIVECKAPEVKIQQGVFDQVAVYNLEFRVPYLVVTNGKEHYCCLIDFKNREIRFLENIPDYNSLLNEGESRV